MTALRLKNLLIYSLVLAAGLAAGSGVAKLPKLFERPYQQGNYTSHFVDHNEVVIYGTTTCPYCARAREFLTAKGVKYADFNIDVSDEARKKYASLNVKAVPAILIGDRMISGFRPDVIEDALTKISR